MKKNKISWGFITSAFYGPSGSVKEKWKWSCPVVSDSLRPHGLCLPGSSVHGIFQAIVLEWIAISFSRDLPNPGIEPRSSLNHQGSVKEKVRKNATEYLLPSGTWLKDLPRKPAAGMAPLCLSVSLSWTNHTVNAELRLWNCFSV